MDIVIREVSLKDIMSTHKRIPEFFETPPDKLLGDERFKNSKTLVLAACAAEEIVGYMVAYDRFKDKSFYCWITGVLPDYRNNGVLTVMMTYLFKWAQKNGYSTIKLKSRNERREMNSFLVKRGFFFTSIEPRSNIKDYRISFQYAMKEDFDLEAKV